MTNAAYSRFLLTHQLEERLHHAVHVLLGLDAGRAFLERHAVDGRAAGHAQRLDRLVDAAGHGFGRVWIDDEDAHGASRSYNRLTNFRGGL